MEPRPLVIWGLLALGICGGVGGAGAPCVTEGNCRCRIDDEDVVDLSSSSTSSLQAVSVNNLNKGESWTVDTYYFNPCKDVPLGNQDLPKNECKSASVCKHSVQFKRVDNNATTINYTMTDLGNSRIGSAEGAVMAGIDGKITIKYKPTTSEAVTTTVILVCIKDENPYLQVENDPKNPVLRFFSDKACVTKVVEPSHHSLGTTLLIIFFVLVLVYLIAGCCVKHFIMGARGLEIIPNYNFWKELPSLVRDGLTFVQNGFRPPPQPTTSPGPNPNPNSYDSI